MKKKKLLSLLLTLAMVSSMVPVAGAAEASDFSDMPDNYATESLMAAVDNGLLSGTGADTLSPEGELTRAQMAAILVRAFGAEDTAYLYGYADVSASAWYYDELAAAVEMGLFQGDGTNLYPDAPITRQEAFVVLARAFALEDGNTSSLNVYLDASSVADWAAAEVAAMVATGYVQGNNGYLNPTATITRQDFAVVMNRMVATYLTEEGDYTDLADGSVMINVADVTLSDTTINGDLIIGDGVGDGDITLDNVTITGNLVLRGGGENTVSALGSTSMNNVYMAKVSGNLRLLAAEGVGMNDIHVSAGTGSFTIEGAAANHIEVSTSDVTVYAKSSTAESASVSASNAMLMLSEGATISTIRTTAAASGGAVILGEGTSAESIIMENDAATLTLGTDATVDTVATAGEGTVILLDEGSSVSTLETAGDSTTVGLADGASVASATMAGADSTLSVADGATVDSATMSGSDSTVNGEGTVSEVAVTGDNTTVETAGTDVTVADGVEGTTADGESVTAGDSVTTESTSTTTTTTTTTGSSSSSSSGSTYYTVTFIDGEGATFTTQSVKKNYYATAPDEEPTLEGYTFVGWMVSTEDGLFDFETAITSATTLTAVWERITYTVTYVYDDGKTSNTDVVYDYANTATTEPTNTPARTGYTFDGWYYNDTAYNFDTAVTGDITLTAKWTLMAVTTVEILNVALADAEDGDTVTLAGAITVAGTVTIPAGVTLDLAGNSLTNGGTITNNGTIVVYDAKSMLVALDANTTSGTVELAQDVAFTASYSPLSAIYGTLDGKSHTLSGMEHTDDWLALADICSDFTMQNLDVKPASTTGQGIIPMFQEAQGTAVTFDNVNILEGDIYTAENDNNESAYICFSFATTLTFKNCTNNLDYTNTKGTVYASAFLGGYVISYADDTSYNREVVFESCINNGDLSMAYASVFVGNGAYMQNATITISDCENNGTITGTKAVAYVAAISNSKLKSAYQNDPWTSAQIDGTDGTLTSVVADGLAIVSNSDSVLEISTCTSGATYYVAYAAYATGDNGTSWCNLVFTYSSSDASDGAITTDLKAYKMIGKTEYLALDDTSDEDFTGIWKDTGSYNCTYQIVGGYIVIDFENYSGEINDLTLTEKTPTITVTAADSSGNLLGTATYSAST